jgi:hypothetical protein
MLQWLRCALVAPQLMPPACARHHHLSSAVQLLRPSGVLNAWSVACEECVWLRRCISLDATDGRSYVALGKLFMQQRRFDEAREVYEEGSTATGVRTPLGTYCIGVEMSLACRDLLSSQWFTMTSKL